MSAPIKLYDCLDHNYTPEEYLQPIEARVTFHAVYNVHLTIIIIFGTHEEWLLYNAL